MKRLMSWLPGLAAAAAGLAMAVWLEPRTRSLVGSGKGMMLPVLGVVVVVIGALDAKTDRRSARVWIGVGLLLVVVPLLPAAWLGLR